VKRKWRELLHDVSAYCDTIIQRTQWLGMYALSFYLQHPLFPVVGIAARNGHIARCEVLCLVIAAKVRPLDVKLAVLNLGFEMALVHCDSHKRSDE
jgi:hypothetical protein